MPPWLRTALQYAPLAERAGRGLARFVRRLRGRETPSLKDAIEANERAEKAIERERVSPIEAEERAWEQAWDLAGEDTPTETPLSKVREPCGFCGHARGAHGLGRNVAACSLCMCKWFA